jgi:thiol-disulfide isomerase/thioredoxin
MVLGSLNAVTLAQETSSIPAPVVTPTPKTLASLPSSVLDAELRSIRGQAFRLSDYQGKVLVIHLFATWCGPCRFEAPVFAKLHTQLQGQGVRFVDLSTENPEAASVEVRRWVRTYRVPYRVGFATTDLALTLMQGRYALPQTFVVSRSGQILSRFVGFNQRDTPPRLRKAIEEALNETENVPTTP